MNNDKLSVTVIGLLPRQAGRLQSDYGDKVDLLFAGSNESIAKIRSTAESSDHVILMTKFISHEIQTALQKRGGLDYCNGGTSSLGLKLDALLSSQL